MREASKRGSVVATCPGVMTTMTRAWKRSTRSGARKPTVFARLLSSSVAKSSPNALGAKKKSAVGADATTERAGYLAYDELLKDELAAQEARKESFERRGLAVITTAGTLVTLLFALGALSVRSAAQFALPATAQVALLIGLVLFGAAALTALTTNVPASYEAVDPEQVRIRLREDPMRSADRAHRDIAFTRAKALDAARDQNTKKGRALVWALRLEAGAVIAVGVAVATVLVS